MVLLAGWLQENLDPVCVPVGKQCASFRVQRLSMGGWLTHPVCESAHGGRVRGQQEGFRLAGVGLQVTPQRLVAQEGPREQEVPRRRRGQPRMERWEEVGRGRGEDGG